MSETSTLLFVVIFETWQFRLMQIYYNKAVADSTRIVIIHTNSKSDVMLMEEYYFNIFLKRFKFWILIFYLDYRTRRCTLVYYPECFIFFDRWGVELARSLTYARERVKKHLARPYVLGSNYDRLTFTFILQVR